MTRTDAQEARADQVRRHSLNRLSRIVRRTQHERERLYKVARAKLRLRERALLEGTDPELLGVIRRLAQVRDVEMGKARSRLHLRETWAKRTYAQELDRTEQDYEVGEKGEGEKGEETYDPFLPPLARI